MAKPENPLSSWAAIIKESAVSPLGVISLALLILGTGATFLFREDEAPYKLAAFLVLTVGVVLLILALFRSRETLREEEEADEDETGEAAESKGDPTPRTTRSTRVSVKGKKNLTATDHSNIHQGTGRNSSCVSIVVVMSVVLFSAVGVVVAPMVSQGKMAASKTGCLSNTKQIGLSVMMYLNDWDNGFPDARHWVDVTFPYTKGEDIYRCPVVAQDGDSSEYGYAMNDGLPPYQTQLAAPANTIVAYDSVSLWRNAHDTVQSIVPKGRHYGYNNICFADGHARSVIAGKEDEYISQSIFDDIINPRKSP